MLGQRMPRTHDDRRARRAASASSASGRTQHERAYMIELGHRLRTLREERGLTQHAVARSAGIATDMISRLENGHYTSPGLRTLLRVADGMGVNVTSMLPDVPNSSSASPEAVLKAKLATLLHRADPETLELIVDLAVTIVNRR